MKSYNGIAAIFFLAIGVFFVLYARTVEIGTFTEPGPGFLPFWGGLTLVAMSIILFLKSYARKTETVRPSFFLQPDSWKRVLAVFLSLIVYNLLLTPLGFTITTFLFLVFLVKFIFPQTWKRSLVVGVLSSIFARLLFINFLETQLPRGLLRF
jgi:putative tricarboxylic transport membrane protein